ncbi:MAG: hypothetical protein ABEJ88_10380 [Halobacterium sp.]
MAPPQNRGPSRSDKTEEIVRVLREYERPFMGTGELAEEMGYNSNPGVTKHLERAVENDAIRKTTISGYNIWYLPELNSTATGHDVTPDNTVPDDDGGEKVELRSAGAASLGKWIIGRVKRLF